MAPDSALTRLKRNTTPAGLFLFALSLLYLSAEIYFNMSLLDIAGDVRSRPDQINGIQFFGRAVSSCGLFLLVLGVFAPTGFRLVSSRQLKIFSGIALLCMLPGFFTLAHFKGIADYGDLTVCMLPFFGIFFMFLGRGRYPAYNVLALFLLIWPAMFLGQKIMIEETLITHTSAQARADARYVLMLRAGFEDCTLSLGDMRLCDADSGKDSVKAARIILSSLWMLHPQTIRRDIFANRDALVQNAVTQGSWFSADKQYKAYIEKVSEKRAVYEAEIIKAQDELTEKYYQPYLKASEMYETTLNAAALHAQSAQAAEEKDRGIEDGWRKYQAAMHDYKTGAASAAVQAARGAVSLKDRLQSFCMTHNCPGMNSGAAGYAASGLDQLSAQAEEAFIARTGYPPGIDTRPEFEAYPATQDNIRAGVEKYIRSKGGLDDFNLPPDWRYDRASFRPVIEDLFRQAAQKSWARKFRNLPQGLSRRDFFSRLGIESPELPPLDKLLMNRTDFSKKILVPQLKQMAVKLLDEIEAEKALYANDAAYEEKGRDYVRAVYIPAIALITSLLIVAITLLRGGIFLLTHAVESARIKKRVPDRAQRRLLRFALIAGFVGIALVAPYIAPNPYASGAGYKEYYLEARRSHPVIARILNWSMHAQPIIYKIGHIFTRA